MPSPLLPTAQALRAEVAATASRAEVLVGLGLATCAQLVPFQCRISVRSEGPLANSPTAQALPAEVAATPNSWLSLPEGPGLGLCIADQERPFQRRIKVRDPGPSMRLPTAQALLPDVADTANS